MVVLYLNVILFLKYTQMPHCMFPLGVKMLMPLPIYGAISSISKKQISREYETSSMTTA